MTTPPSASEVLASPDWLPFEVTETGLRFLAVTPGVYRSASFLDGRILGKDPVYVELAWSELGSPPAPLCAHCIFHIGHVGSTLVSRLLQALPNVFALREPAILRALAPGSPTESPAWAAMPPPARAERLQVIAQLLARAYEPDESVVLKATSYVSDIGPELLGYLGGTAVLLVVKPSIYIASVLDGANTLAELNVLAESRRARLNRYLAGDVALDTDDPAHLAALTWLTEVCALARIAAAHPERCRWVDFEAFLEAPAPHLSRMAAGFDLSSSARDVEAALAGPILGRYSKDPSYAYSPTDRRALAAQAQLAHRAPIARAMAWLNETGAAFPLARRGMATMAAGIRA